jgi:hypothetical protein
MHPGIFFYAAPIKGTEAPPLSNEVIHDLTFAYRELKMDAALA